MAEIPPSAPNTVRLYLPAEKKSVLTIVDIQGHIVEDLLKMPRAEIFCVQAFPNQGFYDISFGSLDSYRTFLVRTHEMVDHPDLQGMKFVVPQPRRQQRTPVTVQMYNPFVHDGEIIAFLERYCLYVSPGEKRKNCLGTFNGLRRFWVEFRPDSDGIGGLSHPPQSFSIGSNRGFLFYPGQPSFCRDCFSFGHTRDTCSTGQVCKNCFRTGHRTADCDLARKCHFCSSTEHLAKQCPKVDKGPRRSYAGVVRGEVPVKGHVPAEEVLPTTEGPSTSEPVVSEDITPEKAPDPLVAEGEELPKSPEPALVSEMEVDKASLKRKSEHASLSGHIEEFPSSVEQEESDRDSDTSSVGKEFLDDSSVKKLARTLNFTKNVVDVKKNKEWKSMQGVQASDPSQTPSSRGRTKRKDKT